MKKLLLVAILMLALVITAVACTQDPAEPETSGDDVTTAETPTDEPDVTAEPTDEPDVTTPDEPNETTAEPDVTTAEPEVTTEEPETTEPETLPYVEPSEAGMKNNSFDTFYVNGQMYFEVDGSASDKLDAQDNTITFELGATHDSMMLRGWIGFDQAMDTFGYYVDTYDFVYGDFKCATEDGVLGAGGEFASRFEITVPLADLGVGEHNVGFIVKLADGTLVLLRSEIKVVIKGLEITDEIKFHTSVDHVNGKGPNDSPNYSGQGGNSNIGCSVIDGAADGKVVGEDFLLSIGGWMGMQGGVNRYVWSVDGLNWFDVQSGGADGEPLPGHYETAVGVTDALKNGLFNGSNMLVANLSAFEGQTVDVTFAAVPETAQDKVVPFVTITGVVVYAAPVDTLPTTPLDTAGDHYIAVPKWNNEELKDEGHYGLTSDARVSFGQKFTVAEGYKATVLYMKHLTVAEDKATDGVIKVYQWVGDYATTVAGEPLWVGTFEDHPANGTLTIELGGELTGTLYYEITATAEEAAEGKFFKPFVATEDKDADTGVSFIDGEVTNREIIARVTVVEIVNPNLVIDLSAIEGSAAWPEAGYNNAIVKIGYDNIFNLGTIDLTQYSSIVIEYSYDGDNTRGDGKTPEECFTACDHTPIIGFTALDKAFGYANVTNQDAIDSGIYTEMQYTTGSWVGATRTATIDISALEYNGVCYLTCYNPWGTEVVVSSITLIP